MKIYNKMKLNNKNKMKLNNKNKIKLNKEMKIYIIFYKIIIY